ncbi:unnamed protein product [Litomosoides sigmodontis]|uniref:SH3 domain-containing protein n=1 Tax=Litomosoides sigmodontis TaxID=42156 RepID=A0A3P6TB33_LITSI|nr:unnamed protein product [Litomosoides sigmodontis]
MSDFVDDPPIFITVRTRTKEGAVSSDSNVCRVPRGISDGTEVTTTLKAIPVASGATRASLMSLTGGQTSVIVTTPTITTIPTATTTTITTPAGAATITTTATTITATTDLLQASQGNATADSRMTSMTNPLNAYSSTTGVQSTSNSRSLLNLSGNGKLGYSGAVGINYNELLNNQQLSTTALYEVEQWKTPNQYYIFHPHALRRDLTTTEEKPSVLEMEHNYLLKHHVPPWTLTPQNSRTRSEHYLRGRTDDRSGRSLANFTTRTRNCLPHPITRVRTEELCSTRSEPDLRPMILDDFSCRWFVALFDYSYHMSPNANAQQEELSFRKHQLIKVFGDIDQDGFYTGQIGHRIGLVPSNMVIEIAKDDLMPPQRRRSDTNTSMEPSLRRMRWGSLKSRSYDHAGDRRPSRSRMIRVSGDQYPSIDRRDYSLPNRSSDYFGTSSRRIPSGDYRLPSVRSEYGGRGVGGITGDDYDMYALNGKHKRDYYGYGREHRPRETTTERDSREYYTDERNLSERERVEFYEPEGFRDPRDRDVRCYREIRENRDARDYRDHRDLKYQREPSMTRRERSYLEEHDDQKTHDYRESREYRELREAADYREKRKEREVDQSVRDGRNYERRIDYGSRHEKGHGHMREYAISSGAPHSYYPSDTVEDSRHGRMTNDCGVAVRKFVAKFDYNSRELSPNVDAEQVELSFHAGDVITVYGEMDEDGFFMGELNEQQSKPKGVVFQESAKKSLPGRQSSQTSSGKPASQVSMKSKSGPATGTGQKTVSKKSSDTSSKFPPNARKSSQTSGKKEGAAKKKP